MREDVWHIHNLVTLRTRKIIGRLTANCNCKSASCGYMLARQQKDIYHCPEFVTVWCSINCDSECDEDHIQRNEGHIQEGGDIQLIQEAIHPPHDGSQHGE